MPPQKNVKFCNKCHHYRPLSLFFGYDRRKGSAAEDRKKVPDMMRTCNDCRSKRSTLRSEETAPTESAIAEAAAAASKPRLRRTVARAHNGEGSPEPKIPRETVQSRFLGSSPPSAERTATRKGKHTVAIHDTDAGSKLVPQHKSAQELAEGLPSSPEKRRRIGINPRNVNGNLPKRIARESTPPCKIPAKPSTKTSILPPRHSIFSRDDDNERTKRAKPTAKRAVTSSHSSKGRPVWARPPVRKVANSDPLDCGEDSPQPAPALKHAANASPTAEALPAASVSKKRKAEEPIPREPPATYGYRGAPRAGPSGSSTSPATSTANRSSPAAAPSRLTVTDPGFAQQPTALQACPPTTVPSATGVAPTPPAHTPAALVSAATAPSDAAPVVVQTTTFHSMAAFIRQLKLLAQLLQLGLDELSVERLDELWFQIRNDWRVDNMNTFLQGFMLASDVLPVEGW